MVARISVRVTPNASRDEVKGLSPGFVEIRLRARALDGKANQALIRFLAAQLGVRPGQVSLERGATSRLKVVVVEGLELSEALQRLGSAV